MKIDAESKFEIGDVLQIKGSMTRFLVQEIIVQKCYGGLQINYHGFPLMPKQLGFKDNEFISYPQEGVKNICESVLEKIG